MRLLGDPTKERYLFGSVAILVLAGLAALLFYVPIVPLAFAIVIVLGLVLMFIFGFYLGVNQNTPPHAEESISSGGILAVRRPALSTENDSTKRHLPTW